MLNKIHNWWINLDPSEHYLYWIVSFAALLFGLCMLLILGMQYNLLTIKLFPYVFLGILGFISLFISVVVFLNFIWPNIYKEEQKKYKK